MSTPEERPDPDDALARRRLKDAGRRGHAARLAAMRTELRARQTEARPRERHELAAQLQRLADVIGDIVPQPGRDDTTQR
ncbi:hypothetical protein [Streptomyces sp. NPDC051132]|uniref:hypothetical protein n=1 Tax=unclassified Streptomyces TaxID=2593676 RepID=UPI00342D5596